MDIKVEITTKDEYDMTNRAISEIKDMNKEIVIDGTSTMIEIIVDNIYGALVSLGYHENTVKEYIKRRN